MDLYKEFFTKLKNFEKRISALESTNQVQKIVANGNTIIDTNGLNSLGSFKRAQLQDTVTTATTTSTSMVDVSGSSFAQFTLSRSTYVLVYMMANCYNSNAISSALTDYVEVELYDTDTTNSPINVVTVGETATHAYIDGGGFLNINEYTSTSMKYEMAVLSFSSGNHDLKLRWRAGGGGTANMNAWLAGYIILGT